MDDRPCSDFIWHSSFVVDDKVKEAFDSNGYIILRKALDDEETSKLKECIEREMENSTKYSRHDTDGLKVTQSTWTSYTNDITGAVVRANKIVTTLEKLLGGEMYMYHAKMCLKEAKTGGAFLWHQDYGYWYANGCLYPNMGTAWVAVDRATKENGCVQLLAGSHQMGRVEHRAMGNQLGADLERVEQIKKVCPLVYAELEPGDLVLFHGNVLHTSAANTSAERRWGLVIAYNRADNNPAYQHHFNSYTPLVKVPDSELRTYSTKPDVEGKKYHIFSENERSYVETKRLMSEEA